MTPRTCILAWFVVLASVVATARAAEPLEITVKPSGEGAAINVGDDPFAVYRTKVGTKPVVWPLVGPTGKVITRGYPVEPQPGETNDHIHQAGMWFTHGDVNGQMFWDQSDKAGRIEHRKFTKLEGGEQGTIVTENDWIARDGKRVCRDVRELAFHATPEARWVDVAVTMFASDGPLEFGDNKEGSFGLRVADSMRVDAKQGGKIVTSTGKSNDAAWGQPAAWVDYHGPIDGEVVGVALFDHPKNRRHPTRWHVRGYGLFAANPFTLKAFEAGQPDGSFEIPAGESITYRYRVLLHKGDETSGQVVEHYKAFVAE